MTRIPMGILTSALVAVAAFMPATAYAASCQGAPGTSAIEQYCEAIATPDGGRESAGDSSSPGKTARAVPSQTAKALAVAGTDGDGIERLVGKTEPGTTRDKLDAQESSRSAAAGPRQDNGESPGVQPPSPPGGNALTASKNAVEAGPVAGNGILWGVVGMSSIGAVAAVMLRRRRLE